jgi:hypothetical protein
MLRRDQSSGLEVGKYASIKHLVFGVAHEPFDIWGSKYLVPLKSNKISSEGRESVKIFANKRGLSKRLQDKVKSKLKDVILRALQYYHLRYRFWSRNYYF